MSLKHETSKPSDPKPSTTEKKETTPTAPVSGNPSLPKTGAAKQTAKDATEYASDSDKDKKRNESNAAAIDESLQKRLQEGPKPKMGDSTGAGEMLLAFHKLREIIKEQKAINASKLQEPIQNNKSNTEEKVINVTKDLDEVDKTLQSVERILKDVENNVEKAADKIVEDGLGEDFIKAVDASVKPDDTSQEAQLMRDLKTQVTSQLKNNENVEKIEEKKAESVTKEVTEELTEESTKGFTMKS